MSSLTFYDAELTLHRPRHLYEVAVELVGRQELIRVRTEGRFEAIALVMETRPGWTFRTVKRFTPSGWRPA